MRKETCTLCKGLLLGSILAILLTGCGKNEQTGASSDTGKTESSDLTESMSGAGENSGTVNVSWAEDGAAVAEVYTGFYSAAEQYANADGTVDPDDREAAYAAIVKEAEKYMESGEITELEEEPDGILLTLSSGDEVLFQLAGSEDVASGSITVETMDLSGFWDKTAGQSGQQYTYDTAFLANMNELIPGVSCSYITEYPEFGSTFHWEGNAESGNALIILTHGKFIKKYGSCIFL